MTLTPARLLAGLAIALGGLAPFAGSPYRSASVAIDIRALAAAVAREEDHVTAVELARWIRHRKPSLRIVDVRDTADFEAFHLPNAERASVEHVVTMPFRPQDTIVLYSQGGAHAAQAWVLLRTAGHPRVYFLRGGIDEWLEDVMAPAIAADATAEERRAFESVADLSRYFGGTPRELPPGESPRSPARDLPAAAARRHGC